MAPTLEQAELVHAIEQMLITTRGVRVQPPGSCVKPAAAGDVDDVVSGVALSGADAAGARAVLLENAHLCAEPFQLVA